MSNQPIFRVVCACIVLAFLGCNSDGLVTLKGKVTVDGAPAPAGISFQFQPLSDGSPSYAITDADGNYEAEFSYTKKGIMVGKHRVSFIPGGGGGGGDEAMPDNIEELGQSNKPVESPAQANRKRPSFPDSYWGEIMQINVENKANVIDIPLESKK
jgi:hypothetical protein